MKCQILCTSGEDKAEVQLKSNMNADTSRLVPYTEALMLWLGTFAENVMNQKVVKTDMKLGHIISKALEVIFFKKGRRIQNILA